MRARLVRIPLRYRARSFARGASDDTARWPLARVGVPRVGVARASPSCASCARRPRCRAHDSPHSTPCGGSCSRRRRTHALPTSLGHRLAPHRASRNAVRRRARWGARCPLGNRRVSYDIQGTFCSVKSFDRCGACPNVPLLLELKLQHARHIPDAAPACRESSRVTTTHGVTAKATHERSPGVNSMNKRKLVRNIARPRQ